MSLCEGADLGSVGLDQGVHFENASWRRGREALATAVQLTAADAAPSLDGMVKPTYTAEGDLIRPEGYPGVAAGGVAATNTVLPSSPVDTGVRPVAARSQHVVPRGDKWAVRKAGAERVTRRFNTQKEAIEAARGIARNRGGEVFIHGRDGRVQALLCSRIEWKQDGPGSRPQMVTVEGGDFELPADLVLLAMGFLHPVHEGMLVDLEVALDPRGNVLADTNDYRTTVDGVFACGDMRRGQSLVVWAIREGRQAARAVDEHLMGSSDLPR